MLNLKLAVLSVLTVNLLYAAPPYETADTDGNSSNGDDVALITDPLIVEPTTASEPTIDIHGNDVSMGLLEVDAIGTPSLQYPGMTIQYNDTWHATNPLSWSSFIGYRNNHGYEWLRGASTTQVKMMSLEDDNTLILYDSMGNAVIAIDPESSAVTINNEDVLTTGSSLASLLSANSSTSVEEIQSLLIATHDAPELFTHISLTPSELELRAMETDNADSGTAMKLTNTGLRVLRDTYYYSPDYPSIIIDGKGIYTEGELDPITIVEGPNYFTTKAYVDDHIETYVANNSPAPTLMVASSGPIDAPAGTALYVDPQGNVKLTKASGDISMGIFGGAIQTVEIKVYNDNSQSDSGTVMIAITEEGPFHDIDYSSNNSTGTAILIGEIEFNPDFHNEFTLYGYIEGGSQDEVEFQSNVTGGERQEVNPWPNHPGRDGGIVTYTCDGSNPTIYIPVGYYDD